MATEVRLLGETEPASSTVDSKPAKRVHGKPFVKGEDSRRNLAGAPPRGESVPAQLKKAMERKSEQLVAKAIERQLRDDAVGNRAFEDGLNRVYGVNKQTFQIEGIDTLSVADTLLDRMLEIASGGNHTT